MDGDDYLKLLGDMGVTITLTPHYDGSWALRAIQGRSHLDLIVYNNIDNILWTVWEHFNGLDQ